MYKSIICIIAAAFFAISCGNHSENQEQSSESESAAHAGHDHAHEGHDHAHEGHDHSAHNQAEPAEQVTPLDEIIFPEAQAALTDFAVEEVAAGPFSEVIKTSGQILSAQGDQVCLSAPVSGIVTYGATKLTDGSPVGQGSSLFYISSKNLVSGDANIKVAANYQKAKADFERAEKLVADRIVSQKEYDEARYAYLQAKSEYDAIAAGQSDKGTSVSTPISGYVVRLEVHEGDFVEMGQVLATVSRSRRLELRADVSQKYYAGLHNVRSARIRTSYNDADLSLDQMNGRLVSIGQAMESSGYMVPVIFEFDNPGNVILGSYVEVYLLGAKRENVISLPLSAITEQQGTFFVYVQIDKEGYVRREVRLGASDGRRVAVLSGLKAGEQVVTRGAIHVKMASASGAIPHGHSH